MRRGTGKGSGRAAALAAGLAATLAAAPAMAEREAVNAYVFANSLVYHVGEGSEYLTAVPHWVDALADAAGRDFAVDGQWGFLRNFARDLPPRPNWGLPGVRDGWPSNGAPFAMQDFSHAVIAPANFIQYQNPDVPYADAGPGGPSPLSAILDVYDHVTGAEPGVQVVLYEGWADLVPVAGAYPPDADGLARYWAFNAADHPAWYDTLEAQLERARPDWDVARIPVSRLLARLAGPGGVLADVPFETLFTDASPHGTPTTYLLAGAMTYAVLFDAPLPADWRPPEGIIAPAVRERWSDIAAEVDALRPASTDRAGAGEAAPATAPGVAPRPTYALPEPGQRPVASPAMAMGLAGFADWSTQHPTLDLMRSSRPWVGHVGRDWGAARAEALRAAGYLDADGWPVAMPPGVTRLETVILTDMPAEARYLRGDYVMLYDGQADFTLTGRASRVRRGDGMATFFYEPGPGLLGLAIDGFPDPDDPMRNVAIVRRDLLPLYRAGGLFNPDWLARIEDMRVLRFMDWMLTNNSVIERWEDRPRMSDATWAAWGAPVEAMVHLANRTGADPWFTMPHLADDDYVRRFAETVRDTLDADRKVYVEFSNEVWNAIFGQSAWARAQAEALWGPSSDGHLQFYALRAAQVADIWTEVFGDAADDRLVRVVSVHTGWPGSEVSILTAPLAMMTLGDMPANRFDAYAVTGYFGYELGGEDMAPVIARWLDASEAEAERAGRAMGLDRRALAAFVAETRFDAAMAPLTEALREGSLKTLTEELFPYHAQVAEDAGLRLIMYEGGTHLAARGAQLDNERVTDFFAAHAYTPEVSKLYEQLMTGWVAAGGVLFNAFVDLGMPSKWGSWGALRHLDDANPRWNMLLAYNATGPADWEGRAPAVFAGGVTRMAPGDAPAVLRGTPRADVLAGGPGDDRLIGAGGRDRLGGGPGRDVAVLPGARADWAFARQAGGLVAEGPAGRVALREIEALSFEAAPEIEIPLADF